MREVGRREGGREERGKKDRQCWKEKKREREMEGGRREEERVGVWVTTIWWLLASVPTYFEGVDKCEVVEGDVIVVVLDITESLLMVLHQRINLAILTLWCVHKE